MSKRARDRREMYRQKKAGTWQTADERQTPQEILTRTNDGAEVGDEAELAPLVCGKMWLDGGQICTAELGHDVIDGTPHSSRDYADGWPADADVQEMPTILPEGWGEKKLQVANRSEKRSAGLPVGRAPLPRKRRRKAIMAAYERDCGPQPFARVNL